MNKKLVALAVVGALSAPLVAEAQTANVTLYGTVRNALVSTKVDGLNRRNGMSAISSRWGLRSTESLSGGLSAVMQLEVGYNSDQNGNNVFNTRESWVGLAGGFGTVKLGAGLTPWDDVFGITHNSIVGEFNNQNNIMGGVTNSAGSNFGQYGINQALVATPAPGAAAATSIAANAQCSGFAIDSRYSNSVRYDSPNFGGVEIATQYALLDEQGGNTGQRKCTGWDTAVKFNQGPISAGLGYARHNNFSGPTPHDATSIRLAAKGTFGMFMVNGAVEQHKYVADNGATGSAKANAYMVGAAVQLGASRIGLDYHNRNNGVTSTATSLATNTAGGGKMTNLYLNHDLSKRTTIIAWAVQIKSEAATNNKQTQLGFALRHNF